MLKFDAGINIFYNHDGNIETIPSYHSDIINGGRQITFGDMDGDGFLDLAAAGIEGGFVVYKNINGTLEERPSWWCFSYQEPSCVAWGDVDGDGDLDLAAGIWYGLVGVFENDNGTLSSTYHWEYPTDGFCQHSVWFDYDEDAIVTTSQTFTGDGKQKIFYINHAPIHQLSTIMLDGKALSPDKYCHDRVDGWISLKNAPAAGEKLTMKYSYSNDLDLTVSAGELYIFENTSTP